MQLQHSSMRETDLRGSVAQGEAEGGGEALVSPACKVDQLHAEAAAEPHDIGGAQIPMHNLPLVQPCHCLAHLHMLPDPERLTCALDY